MDSHDANESTEADTGSSDSEAPQRVAGWLVLVLLIAYAGFEAWPFLGDGLPIFFDAHSHLSRTWMTHRALAAGQYPSWSNDWYSGYRLLEFSSPAYYLVTASVGFLTRDIVSATKLVLWLGQILGTAGFFAFTLRMFRNPMLAAFASLLFVHSTGRLVVLGTMGNYPSLLLYAFVPFLLRSWWPDRESPAAVPEKVGRLFGRCALPGLLIGGLLLAHLSNTVAILPALLAFGWAAHRTHSSHAAEHRRALSGLIAALGVGLALAAFSIVPLFLHLHRASLSFAMAAPELHLASVARSLGIIAYSPDHAFATGHGAVLWGLGLAAGLATLHSSLRRYRPLGLGLLVSLASALFLGDRSTLALPFFLLPLCAVAVEILMRLEITRAIPSARALIPALACAAAILAPWPDLGPLPRYQPTNSLDLYRGLPATRLPSRTFDVTTSTISLDGFYGWSSVSPMLSGRSIPFGGFPQGAALDNNLSLALGGNLAAELRSSPPLLSEDGADFLYLLNVELLVDRNTAELRRRVQLKVKLPPVLRDMQSDPKLGWLHSPGIFRLRHASPAIFAPRIEPLPEEFATEATAENAESEADAPPQLFGRLLEQWRRDPLGHHPDASLDVLFRTLEKNDGAPFLPLLRDLGLDRAAARADLFYVDRLETARGPRRLASAPRFEVLRHEEEQMRVELDVRASDEGFVRLSYSHDPDLIVRIDGQPVDAMADALGGGVVLPLNAGSHTVVIERPANGLRDGLLALSTGGALALMGLVVWTRRARPEA